MAYLEKLASERLLALGLPASLTAKGTLVEVPKGRYVIREGDPSEFVFFLLRGKVKVGIYAANGRVLTVDYCENEGFFGDIELFLGIDYCSNVTTVTDAVLLRFSKAEVAPILLDSKPFLLSRAKALASNLKISASHAALNVFLPLRSRFCSYILSKRNGLIFREKLTEVSETLGCSYRQLERVTAQLMNEKAIRKAQRGVYLIQNLAALEKASEEKYERV